MSIVPDQLFQFGGAPVTSGGSNYYGWWKSDTYFVDYDNGGTNSIGKNDIDAPAKHLAVAIADAGKWDVIYVRPRDPDTSGGDSNYITPASATNWNVPHTSYGLAIIGTGIGLGRHGQAYNTYLRGHASVTTGSVLHLEAPFATIENLAFHRGGGTSTGIVLIKPDATATASSFSASVNNCLFRFGNGSSVANSALVIEDSWYSSVYNSTFYRNRRGIGLNANNSTIRATTIKGCVFEGAAGDIDNHISSNSSATYITIVDNVFMQAIPTKGSNDYYIDFGAGTTCSGIISNNVFGTTTTTATSLVRANGLSFAKNYIAAAHAIAGTGAS
jgi:hypothetical protein